MGRFEDFFSKSANEDTTSKELADAMILFMNSSDDSEDSLFLSLTQKEVVLLGVCFILLRAGVENHPEFGFLHETLYKLSLKIQEAMTEQKLRSDEDE